MIALRRAIAQYLVHFVLFSVATFLFTQHPFFVAELHDYARTGIIFLFAGFAAFGFPYFFLRYRVFVTSTAAYRQEKLCLIYDWFRGRLAKNDVPTARTALLSYVVKFFFFPLMLSFLIGHTQAFLAHAAAVVPTRGVVDFFWQSGYHLFFNLIFIIDTGVFAAAYLVENRWLGNRIRSVDPFPSSWVVALICYPPFNFGMNEFLPLTRGEELFSSPWFAPLLSILMLLAFTVYVAATVALGWRAGNLVHRGIVRRGPYRFVRHPAYAAKNLAWWLEFIPFLTPLTFIALLGWNVIYVLRGLTEERHLAMDPEYRKYQKEVKWRFIPGVW